MVQRTEKLKADKHGLGLANLTQKAVWVSDFDYEHFDVILPPITFALICDKADDLLPEGMDQAAWDALEEEARDDLIQSFTNSSAYFDWKDGYNPIMLYYWPCFIHGKDTAEVARLMDEFAPCATLLEINGDDLKELVGEDYAIVLSGGGMNLCDHLALAYICAGSVPPIELLTGLKGVISKSKADRCKGALVQAFDQARGWMISEADRLLRDRRALYAGKRDGVNRHA